MGNIYSKLRDFENADLMADSSLMVGKRTNVTNSIGRNYVTLGNSRFQQKKYPEALKFFKTGLENAIYYKNSKSSISNLYIKIGNIYEVMDSLEKAKENYIKALQIGEGDNDLINNINLSLSKMFFKEGNYLSAYKYQRDYNLFKDSVFTNEKIRIITELNTRYDSEKKDQQLQILSKDRLLQEALLVKQLKQLEKDAAEKREQQLAIINFQLEDDKKDQLLRIKELDLENNRIKHNEQEMILSNTTSKLKLEEQEKLINLNTIRNQKSLFVIMFSVMIIIGIISFLLFNRYKLKKRLQVQSDLYQQRQQISRDLHDEIGATLSGIAMYSHLAKEQLKKSQTGSIENSLSIIQNNAGEMVNKLNDIVWLINPGHDSLQQLMQRLEDYAVQMAAVKNIRIKSNINGWKQESLLNAEIRRNIYLLFKEAINNAIKYSNATLLEFYANNENNKLEIILKDNGDGFEVDKVKRGNGLNSILQRGKDIGADVQLIASPGKGCMLIMNVPCL
jgi:two-component system sensor histidine kinase UhpB